MGKIKRFASQDFHFDVHRDFDSATPTTTPESVSNSKRTCRRASYRSLGRSRLLRSDICDICPISEQNSCFLEASQMLFDEEHDAGSGSGGGGGGFTTPLAHAVEANRCYPQLRCSTTQCFSVVYRSDAAGGATADAGVDHGTADRDDAFEMYTVVSSRSIATEGDRTTEVRLADAWNDDTDELRPDETLFVSARSVLSVIPTHAVQDANVEAPPLRPDDETDDPEVDGCDLMSGACDTAISGIISHSEMDAAAGDTLLSKDAAWWERVVVAQTQRVDTLMAEVQQLR